VARFADEGCAGDFCFGLNAPCCIGSLSPSGRGLGSCLTLASPSLQRKLESSDFAFGVCYRQVARLRGGRSVRLPAAGLPFFACPKKGNPKKGQPRVPALRASPAKCAEGLRGFSTVHPCTVEKLAGIHAGHPAGFPPSLRRVQGAPRSRAAREARTWCRHVAPEERACRTMSCGAAFNFARDFFGSSLVARRSSLVARRSSLVARRFCSWLFAFLKSARNARCSALPLFPSTGSGVPFSLLIFLLGKARESKSAAGRRTKRPPRRRATWRHGTAKKPKAKVTGLQLPLE
jgi:hypothetical protein